MLEKIFCIILMFSVFITQQLNATPMNVANPTPLIAKNNMGYIGQSLSHQTGLMVMGGYRAYSPSSGTFLKQDSYSTFQSKGTFNGFNYGAGNPIIWADQTGHMPDYLAGLIMYAAALTGGITLATIFIFLDSRERPRRQENTQPADTSVDPSSLHYPSDVSSKESEGQTPGVLAAAQGISEGTGSYKSILTADFLEKHDNNSPQPLTKKADYGSPASTDYADNGSFHSAVFNEDQPPGYQPPPENVPTGGVSHLLADDNFD